MNEEELNKKARKLRIAAAASAASSIAAGIACVIASKTGLIAPTSVLKLMAISAVIPFSIGLAWSLGLPGEVWRKALEPFGGEKDFMRFVTIAALAMVTLVLAIQLHISIKTETKLDEISARIKALETGAVLNPDFVSPAGDPPMTLAEAASVLSNAYGRIWRTNDVDREIGRIMAVSAPADRGCATGAWRAVSAGRIVEISGEGNGRPSVRGLGLTPEPKISGSVKKVDRTKKDEKPSPPYYGPF